MIPFKHRTSQNRIRNRAVGNGVTIRSCVHFCIHVLVVAQCIHTFEMALYLVSAENSVHRFGEYQLTNLVRDRIPGKLDVEVTDEESCFRGVRTTGGSDDIQDFRYSI